MNDAVVLLRDIAGDAAQKAADNVNPSEDALANLDQPAEPNTWHDKPDLSGASIKQQIQSRLPIGKEDLKEVAGDASAAAHPAGSRDPAATADLAASQQQQAGSTSVDPMSGAQTAANNLQKKVSDGTPEERKQQLREYRERTNDYFKKKLPKDRRDQLVYRLKKMVVEIQGHRDCKTATTPARTGATY